MKSSIHIPKPIIKWVGGKTQIVNKIIEKFPNEINNYREIFLGGGSILLSLLTYVQEGLIKINGNIYAYDTNEPLIYLYKNIQTHPEELFIYVQEIIKDFNGCLDNKCLDNKQINRKPKNISEAKESKENYYYWIRNEYNKMGWRKNTNCE